MRICVWRLVALAALLLTEFSNMCAAYDNLPTINQSDYIAWYNQGESFYKTGDYDRASTCYNMAVEINKSFLEAWNGMAKAFYKNRQYKECVQADDKILELDPYNATIWISKGSALAELHDYEGALNSYNEALGLNQEDLSIWRSKGLVLYEMDKYEDAIDAFNIVLSNNSSDTQIWFKMGASLFHLGKFAESIESFNRVIGVDGRYSTTAKEYAKIAAAENASGEDHHCEQDSDEWFSDYEWTCESNGMEQQYKSAQTVITSVFGAPSVYQLADFNLTIDFHPARIGYTVIDNPNRCSRLELVYPNPARISDGDYCVAELNLIAENLSDPSLNDDFDKRKFYIYIFMFSGQPDTSQDALSAWLQDLAAFDIGPKGIGKSPLALAGEYNITTPQGIGKLVVCAEEDYKGRIYRNIAAFWINDRAVCVVDSLYSRTAFEALMDNLRIKEINGVNL